MDACGDPSVQEVTLLWCAQSGKSTGVLGNYIGYRMHWEPRPMIYMAPNVNDVEDFSRLKLEPMIDATPALRSVVAPPRGRDKSSTIVRKEYPGGSWLGVGSNSPRGLRGRSAPDIVEDECDAYEPTKEGDPSELLWRRARAYPKKKRIRATTPTVKGRSRGEAAYLQSDRRRWWVPCPHCGHWDTYRWAQFVIGRDEEGEKTAEGSYLECAACEGRIEDHHKRRMNAAGEWRAERPFRGHAGFHLPALALPWVTWAELAKNFLNAQAAGDLQTWLNTDLAETWDEPGKSVDPDSLLARVEDYGCRVPVWVLFITMGVDVQDDRVEASRWGYGLEGETWLIDHTILYGDTAAILEAREDTRLEDLRRETLERADGRPMRVVRTCVDSGGHYTDEVYRYAKRRRSDVAAIRGRAGRGIPLWPIRAPRSSKKKVGRVTVFTLGVDTGKRKFYERLSRERPMGQLRAPGYVHLPRREEVTEEFCRQLCGEIDRKKMVKGHPADFFEQVHPRVEGLDCRVYADAAAAWLAPNWIAVAQNMAPLPGYVPPVEPATGRVEPAASPAALPRPPVRRRRRRVRSRGLH